MTLPRHPEAFSLSAGKKRPRINMAGYLDWIRDLPSVLSGRSPVEACHIRFGSYPHGKRETGKSEKPDDIWCLPMTPDEHHAQHATNERKFWQSKGIDPLLVCSLLFVAYHRDDRDAALLVLQSARELVSWNR